MCHEQCAGMVTGPPVGKISGHPGGALADASLQYRPRDRTHFCSAQQQPTPPLAALNALLTVCPLAIALCSLPAVHLSLRCVVRCSHTHNATTDITNRLCLIGAVRCTYTEEGWWIAPRWSLFGQPHVTDTFGSLCRCARLCFSPIRDCQAASRFTAPAASISQLDQGFLLSYLSNPETG
jgi:hypothetical protein